MNSLRSIMGRSKWSWLVPACLFLFVTACASNQAPRELTPTVEAELVKRVTERWHALEKKDFAGTYKYTTPKYREVFSNALYVKKFSYAVDWELTGVEVLDYDARAAVASVTVRVMSKPVKQTSAASNAIGALPLTMREKWIHVNGKWWHSARD